MFICLTILLLLGGTVDPVVLICRPDHLKLVEKDLEFPGIGHKGVNVWGTVARPVLDQIWRQRSTGYDEMGRKSVLYILLLNDNIMFGLLHTRCTVTPYCWRTHRWRSFSGRRWSGRWPCTPQSHTATTEACSTPEGNWLSHGTEIKAETQDTVSTPGKSDGFA